MALMTHSSFEGGSSSKKEIMIIKKDIYMNEEGMCMESSDGMPKGWRKELIARRLGNA